MPSHHLVRLVVADAEGAQRSLHDAVIGVCSGDLDPYGLVVQVVAQPECPATACSIALTTSTPPCSPVVERWLGSPNRRIWLAEDINGTPVGYVMGVRIDRLPNPLVAGAVLVELDQVVVDPGARGQGIATALCGAVLEWAAGLGADRVELSTWAFNESAQSLFAKLGFTPDYLRFSRPANNA